MRVRQLPVRPVAAALGGALVIVAGLLFGLWWAGVVVGLAIGWWLRGPAIPVTAGLAALLGWGLPLLADALAGQPIGRTAQVIGVILGVPSAAAGIGATLLVGIVFCLVGAWLASALRAAAAIGRTSDPATPGHPALGTGLRRADD